MSPRANDQIDEAVVRKAPIFSGLDDAAASSLRASMTFVKLRKGQSLFKEGDDGDHLFIVSNGKVKLGTKSPDGRENLLMILGPGDMFGDLSLFDSGPRTATATAVTDKSFYLWARTKLFLGLKSIPKFHFIYLHVWHHVYAAPMK